MFDIHPSATKFALVILYKVYLQGDEWVCDEQSGAAAPRSRTFRLIELSTE